jgi:hypothetical protein
MKKTLLGLMCAGALLATVLPTGTVSAAGTTGSSTASIEVEGDTSENALILEETPAAFTFDKITIGQTVTDAISQTQSGNFKVRDQRGGFSGYKIMATATDLSYTRNPGETDEKTYNFDADSLTMTATASDTTILSCATGAELLVQGGSAIVTGLADSRGETQTTSVELTLNNSDTAALVATTYTGTINYELSDANL